jgi:hypothetical protein
VVVVVMFCVGDPAEPRLATCSGLLGKCRFGMKMVHPIASCGMHQQLLSHRLAAMASYSPSSLSPHSLDRIQDWLRASPDPALTASPLRQPTPPKSPATTPPRLKRPRDASPCDMDNGNPLRSSSPIKRRRKEDDFLSE